MQVGLCTTVGATTGAATGVATGVTTVVGDGAVTGGCATGADGGFGIHA